VPNSVPDLRPTPARESSEPARGTAVPVRKIAAILCADVAAYSRLMGDDDVATLHDIVATRRVLHSHVAECSGRLLDTAGDSMLADFGSAVDALRAAVAIQQELAAENALKPEARHGSCASG
jgi:adenylate cyclase